MTFLASGSANHTLGDGIRSILLHLLMQLGIHGVIFVTLEVHFCLAMAIQAPAHRQTCKLVHRLHLFYRP